jgi:hypothetical protein
LGLFVYLPAALKAGFCINLVIPLALAAQTRPASAPAPTSVAASAPATLPAHATSPTPQAIAATTTRPATMDVTAAPKPAAIATHPATTSAPTTAPSSAPSTAPALDQSSPKALLRSFFASHGEVDEGTIRSLLHASNPIEQKVLDSLAQVEMANGRLRSAEKEKFGKASTAPSVASSLEPTSLSELESFVEKIDGDHATVSTPRVPATSMEFVRTGGKWAIPISSLVGKLDPAVAETMGTSTAVQVQEIDAVTAEVRAGKLIDEAQVRAELTKRLEARIAATRPLTTQPATQAVTQPASKPTTQTH